MIKTIFFCWAILLSPTVSAVASYQLFSDNDFSILDFAKLVDFADVDFESIKLSKSTIDRLIDYNQRHPLKNEYSNSVDIGVIPALVTGAIESERSNLESMALKLSKKNRFIEENGLVSIDLSSLKVIRDSSKSPLLRDFKAELYATKDGKHQLFIFRKKESAVETILPAITGEDSLDLNQRNYYKLAKNIFLDYKKRYPNANPIILGHGLGGGLAQYIAFINNWRAVVFNSSRIPNDLLSDGVSLTNGNITNISVFHMHDDGKFTPDPISIKNNWSPASIKSNVIESRRHIVPPMCLHSTPKPFLNAEEEKIYNKYALSVLFSPALLNPPEQKFTAAAYAIGIGYYKIIMGSALWDDPHDRFSPIVIKTNASKLILRETMAYAGQAAGLYGAYKVGRKIWDGDYLDAFKTIAVKVGIKATMAYIEQDVMAHDMGRLVRGFESTSGISSKIFFRRYPESIPKWESQCVDANGADLVENSDYNDNSAVGEKVIQSPESKKSKNNSDEYPKENSSSKPTKDHKKTTPRPEFDSKNNQVKTPDSSANGNDSSNEKSGAKNNGIAIKNDADTELHKDKANGVSKDSPAKWTLVLKDERGSRYVDYSSFKRDGAIANSIELFDMAKPILGIWSVVSHRQYDCLKRNIRQNYVASYESSMAVGDPKLVSKEEKNYGVVEAGSFGEFMLTKICNIP